MKTIFAVDNKWGLGKKNDLLFSLKEDMRHFVAHTKGKTVVMGSNTLLSFPNGMPLKTARISCLTRTARKRTQCKKDISLSIPRQAVCNPQNYDSEQTYVIGGAMMYRTLLPYCDTAYVTKVDADGGAEVFHENLDDMPNWQLVEQSEPIDDNGYKICFCTYKNNAVKEF